MPGSVPGGWDEPPERSQRLAIPFVGYGYYKKTRFHFQISKVLDDEGIEAKNFFIKDGKKIMNLSF